MGLLAAHRSLPAAPDSPLAAPDSRLLVVLRSRPVALLGVGLRSPLVVDLLARRCHGVGSRKHAWPERYSVSVAAALVRRLSARLRSRGCQRLILMLRTMLTISPSRFG